MSDQVFLQDMQFFGFHGINPEETTLGQRFAVDVCVHGDLRRAGQMDDLAQTISYSRIAKHVRAIVEGPPRQLIEAVAEEIADRLLATEPLATAVDVTVRKPHAPLKGIVMEAAGVRIHRTRETAAQ
jgi:7,8-dihydroneopterin aldolase/epimerase/oxygenase